MNISRLQLPFRKAGWYSAIFIGLALSGRTFGQILDDPVAVPVHFQGQFNATSTGDPENQAHINIFVQNAGSSAVAAYGESAGGTNQMTSNGFARLRPGKTYWVEIGTYSATRLRVKVTPPTGHRVFINGVEHEMFDWAMGGGGPLDPQGFFSLRLDDGSGGAVGEASTLRPGRLLWSVGLGSLRNGKPAGSIRLSEDGLTANAFKPAALYYDRDAKNQNGRYQAEEGDVVVVKVNNVLRQVYATTIFADIVENNDHSYYIKLYSRLQVTDPNPSGALYSVSGDPLYEFFIENPSHPALNSIRITKTVKQNGETKMWTEMTKSTPSANATQWLVQDWVNKPVGATVVSSPVRHRWTYTDNDRNEHLRIEDSAGNPVRVAFKRYEDYNFGVETARELYYEVHGGNPDPLTTAAAAETSGAIKSTYTYHTSFSDANAGNWRKIATVDGNDSSRAIFHYKNEFASRGQIFEVRKPHKDLNPSDPGSGSDGEITTFAYDFTDGFGTNRLPTRIETKINNVVTARSDFSYTNETVIDNSSSYDPGNETMPLTVVTRKDYYDNTQFLTTKTRIYREDADPQFKFFPGLLHSVERPDQTMSAMVYYRAEFQSSSNPFFADLSGSARVHVAIHGTSDSTIGASMTAYSVLSQALPSNFRVVSGKSTSTRSLIGILGIPIVDEKSALVSNSWAVVGQGVVGYTELLWPSVVQRRTSALGALFTVSSNTWSGGRLTESVNETGINQTFAYDDNGRVSSITRAGATWNGHTIAAQTVTQAYDAAGAVTSSSTTDGTETITSTTTYDTAGRVTGQTSPGQGTTTIAYNVASRMTTVTLPTSFSRVETRWRDGRTASVTGTAVVAEYFDAEVDTGGRRKFTNRVRGANDVRKEETWIDWLGRPIERRRPGFNNASIFTETMVYDLTRGHLTTATRSQFADTRFEYNGMGERIRSGLDINGSGLQPASSDRIQDSDTSIENYEGEYWLVSKSWAFHKDGVDQKVLTGVTRERITGLSDTLRGETRAWDADNNETRRTITVNRGEKRVTVTTTRPGIASAATETSLNGFGVSATGHDGLTFSQAYDALGRLKSVTAPRTGTAADNTFSYHNNTSLVKYRRDASNRVVSTTHYDGAGRPNFSQDAATGTVRIAYNSRGQVEYRWGSAGYPVSYGYDEYGQLTHQRTYRDPTNSVTNNWEATAWPGGNVSSQETRWDYDSYTGLLTKKHDPSGQFVEYTYNERGQTHQRFWARTTTGGQRVTATYGYHSGTGELHTVTYNDSTPTVTYGAYSRLGQLENVTDDTGTRSFIYDTTAPWRLNSENLPGFYNSRKLVSLYETTTSTNTGDTNYAGHTLGSVNGRYLGYRFGTNPTATSFELEQTYATSSADRLAGLITKTVVNGTANQRRFVYGYEANSSLVKTLSVTGNAFFVTRNFEPNRDLITQIETRWSGSTRTSYAYAYNDLRQRESVVQSGGQGEAFDDLGATHQQFAYNSRGEVTAARSYNGAVATSTADPLAGRQFEYDYDAIGNRKHSNATGNNVERDHYTVDGSLNQYTQRENNTLTVGGTAAAGALVAVSAPVPAAASGQILAERPPNGTYWGGRIVVPNESAPFQGAVTAYAALPGAGAGGKDLFRVESKTAWLPPVVQSFTYDPDGNLKGDGMWDYTWDAENRLIKMTATTMAVAAGRPNIIIKFRYDHLNRRVSKEVLTGTSPYPPISERRFVYDGWNPIAEIDGSGTLQRSYAWGLDLSASTQGAGGVGGLLQIHDYGLSKTLFPAYDGNGNVAALLNADTGAIEASYEYSPFGELQRSVGTYAAENPFRFSTKYQDDETGLLYYGVRYYSPREGRFINRDPAAEQGGLNLYGFCGNDGVNNCDYLGYKSLWDRIKGAFNGLAKISSPVRRVAAVVVSAVVGVVVQYYGGPGYETGMAVYNVLSAVNDVIDAYNTAASMRSVRSTSVSSGSLSRVNRSSLIIYSFDEGQSEGTRPFDIWGWIVGIFASNGLKKSRGVAIVSGDERLIADRVGASILKNNEGLERIAAAQDVAIKSTPILGQVVLTVELATGRNQMGGKVSRTDAAIGLGAGAAVGSVAGVVMQTAKALPVLRISASKYPELAENILHAQRAGHPQTLTHQGGKAFRDANRDAALREVPEVKGLSRDEYPFASAIEGGEGAWVGHIPEWQQDAQGAIIANFIRKHKLNPGDQYKVIIEP